MFSPLSPNRLRAASLVIAFCILAMFVAPSGVLADATHPQESGPDVDTPIVESEHPYANNFNNFWTVEMPGAQATRIHFSRIELEENADFIVISDPTDRRVQVITGSYPAGLWTDPVPGEFVKISLLTDDNVQKWGFAVDQKGAVSYASKARSAHPYRNGTDETWTIYNTGAGSATRIHFSRIELEENVDWLVLSTIEGTPYQYITGNYPNGLWSIGIPGIAVKTRLITDSTAEKWGFNVDQAETASVGTPQPKPSFTTLIESEHPYPHDATFQWTVTNPDPNALSSKIHFFRIELGNDDAIQLFDANDVLIQSFGEYTNVNDIWSDNAPGRIVKVKLISRYVCCTDPSTWGLRVDQVATSIPNPGLAQSDHPYPEDTTREWVITNPDATAVSSKVHFSVITLGQSDSLQILDANDTVIQTWDQYFNASDVWSDYLPGRIVKIKLRTRSVCCEPGAWGFRLDRIAGAVQKPGLAQSSHPYPEGTTQEWTLTNPNVSATSTKVHFYRIALSNADSLYLLDANGTVVQSWGRYTSLTDIWSEEVPGRIIKVRLTTVSVCCEGAGWGFRLDDMYPASLDPITPASISGVYLNVVHPGRIYLNNVQVAYAQEPGEYKVLLPGLGEYTIRIEYVGYTQEIRVIVREDTGMSILYMPLVQTNR